MPDYNSSAVCAAVSSQFDDDRAQGIAEYVDEFARGAGRKEFAAACYYGGHGDPGRKFKKQAFRYAAKQYGFPPLLMWLLAPVLKRLIMSVIEAFLDQVISARGAIERDQR